jgi:phenylacetate-CoA ligase
MSPKERETTVARPLAALHAPGAAAALRVARRAIGELPGYRELLERHGLGARAPRALDELPYTDKSTVFGGALEPWIAGGSAAAAAELLTSSGQSGAFSVGLTSPAEQRAQGRLADDALRALGARPESPTLLLNCLPMGIGVPTRVATVATPSVHLGMAVELLGRLTGRFDRLVILAEPLFLKALAEDALTALGPDWAPPATFAFVGGEWVAESLRTYVSGVAGLGDPSAPGAGILVSMGAAEIGLHGFFETPELRAARRALDDRAARRGLFGWDRGYGPTLLTFDPSRLHVEERRRPGGETTIAVTTLAPRLMPLVRYDLGDIGELVPAEALNDALAARGAEVRLEDPVVAVWGRVGEARGPDWSLRPELVKERLFASPAVAASLTGRFYVESREGEPWLHLQLRPGASPAPGAAAGLRELLRRHCGGRGEVVLHDALGYPHHVGTDFQHKPRYHGPDPAPRPGAARRPVEAWRSA